MERNYMSVCIALVQDKRKPVKGGYRVAVRVTHNYRRIYISTGKTMDDDGFARMMKSSKGEWYEMRKQCEGVFDNVFNSVKKMADAGTFSIDSLKSTYGSRTVVWFNDYANGIIEEIARQGRLRTAKAYTNMLRKIEDMYGKVRIDSITPQFINDCVRKMEKQGLSVTTQNIYLRHLKAILNRAISEGVMDASQYPFKRSISDVGKIGIRHGRKRTECVLSVEQVSRLDSYGGKERWAVDMWMLSYLCNGMNLTDIAELRSDNIKDGEIRFVRQKTKRTASVETVIRVPMIPRLKELIPDKDGLLFPQVSMMKEGKGKVDAIDGYGKRVNKALRSVCDSLGLPHATMTWARHSYKTNLIRKGVPDYYTELAMGHSVGGVGSHYVAMFTLEDLVKYNSLLLVV